MIRYFTKNVLKCVAFVSLVCVSQSAYAGGDARRYYSPPAYKSWTGFYAGLQVGYGWDEDSDVRRGANLQTNDGPLEYSTAVGGVHIGYNLQRGMWVFGLEGDIDIMAGEGDDEGRGVNTNGIDTNWAASFRARLGIADRNYLYYLTGGYSYLDADGFVSDVAGQGDIGTSFSGWTAGIGLERFVDSRTTIRLEYRYTDYDLESENYATAGYLAGFEPEIHVIKLGVSAKF